jgi:glyoxylase-like metal-dependent hydrolase (beta-lactamase superfamily II)
MARTLYRSLTEGLLALPDDLVLYPAHYGGSVCGRGLSSDAGVHDRLRAPPQRRASGR